MARSTHFLSTRNSNDINKGRNKVKIFSKQGFDFSKPENVQSLRDHGTKSLLCTALVILQKSLHFSLSESDPCWCNCLSRGIEANGEVHTQTHTCSLYTSSWCQNILPRNYVFLVWELVRKLCAIKGMACAKIISHSLPPYYPFPPHSKWGSIFKLREPGWRRNLKCGSGLQNFESSSRQGKQNNHCIANKLKHLITSYNKSWSLSIIHEKVLSYLMCSGTPRLMLSTGHLSM